LTERFGHLDIRRRCALNKLTERFSQEERAEPSGKRMERAMYRRNDEEPGLSTEAHQAQVRSKELTDELNPAHEPAGKVALPALLAPPPAASPAPKPLRVSRRRVLAGLAAAAVTAAGGAYGAHWWNTGRFMVWTDDAYVRAYNTTLAAKVAGYVASMPVEDNARVNAGDVLATIDDGDYQLAVEAARGKVATQEATVERLGRQVTSQEASVDQAKAQLVSAQAGQRRMQLEHDRQQALAGREFASRQTLEQAIANRDQSNAAVQSAQAALEAAQANVAVTKAQQIEASRTLDELRTALAKAERDLSFTVIRAPVTGVFGNRTVQTGDFVQTGQRVASLVPLDEVFIEANFKETQLGRLQPGQKVKISVDALPGHPIGGTVASLSPASGAVFTLLPPDNATGNFTKIVQRLPVRIGVPADVATQRLLRPGMSVEVSVDTRPGSVADQGSTSATQTAAAGR
jgi:membrane fusion protein (multidrug efflux system)